MKSEIEFYIFSGFYNFLKNRNSIVNIKILVKILVYFSLIFTKKVEISDYFFNLSMMVCKNLLNSFIIYLLIFYLLLSQVTSIG